MYLSAAILTPHSVLAIARYQDPRGEVVDGVPEHVVRRQGVAHLGYEPTKSEAERSLRAADDFIAHVASRLQGMREQQPASKLGDRRSAGTP
jgi:hypothetical protein